MALQNKLGITDSAELAREEERRSKKRAVVLYDNGLRDSCGSVHFKALPKFISFCLTRSMTRAIITRATMSIKHVICK